MDVRPRRSALYMPGSNARALEKARTLDADVLIFDLEDAVAPDAKASARDLIREAIRTGGYGRREIVVRINAIGTLWSADDLVAMARSGAHAILLPKVESAETVRLAAAELSRAGAPDDLALWCMIETPLGVLNVREIAAAHGALRCLVMGTSDLAKDLRSKHTAERLPMLTSLGLTILAARAYGLAVLDGVFLDLADDAGFLASCRQGAELGFDGKTLIHPKTIAAANEAFAPREEELAFARRVIDAHAEARAAGKGVVLVDGRLIERLHVAEAERLIALSHAIEAIGGSVAPGAR
ncbi:MAG: CoA ester lyase [Alphaproteobacteria bacterium]